MKKLIIFLCLLMALPVAANKKTFKAACLNVDGLPPTVNITGITNIKMNPEGPQETGTEKMSELIANKGWDFFAVSEAFNYNDILMSKIKGQYTSGTFRDAIPTSLNGIQALQYVELSGTTIREDRVKKSFDTDGLNLIYKNNVRVSGQRWTGWNQKYGVTKNGSDLLIDKGYRFYTVSLGVGLDVDVYILHMDAETSPEDNAARESQINQLVTDILQSDNKRPIIIMGDTNCRYTRDRLKELLIDQINKDSRFNIHDPWIDFMWNGAYPNVGDNALMVSNPALGHQKGEVVDKIFYINNTDAPAQLTAHGYLHDMDFTWPDGSEISDHFPIVIEFTIETEDELIDNAEYYIRNVSEPENPVYIRGGKNWCTQGTLSHTGDRFFLEPAESENEFYLKTTYINDQNQQGYLGHNLYLDNPTKEAYVLTNVGNGKYRITKGQEAITANLSSNVIEFAEISETDNRQLWEIVTRDQLSEELANTDRGQQRDATFMLSGSEFNRFDTDGQNWENYFSSKGDKVFFQVWGNASGNEQADNFVARIANGATGIGKGSQSKYTYSRKIGGLPNGKYTISCKIIRDNQVSYLYLNNTQLSITEYSNKGNTNCEKASQLFVEDPAKYTVSHNVDVKDGNLEIKIEKSESNTSAGVTAFDSFKITYLGPSDESIAAMEKVKKAIDDAKAKAENMGYTTYVNSVVEERYNNRTIAGNGDEEVHMTYLQLANAARKHTEIPSDMRYTILNNSFEMGDLSEWDASGATSASVVEDNSVDGKYIMRADGGSLSQTIQVTMPAGVYELKANLSAGASLTAGTKTSKPVEGDGMQEVTLRFIIDKGTETIGVKADGAFSADNFLLTRIANSDAVNAYEIVSVAIKDATERVTAMGSPYSDDWDLSKYQAMIDNFTIEGDGTKEFNEIYGLLREKVYSQPGETGGANYTNAIINPDFEFGNTLGWTTELGSEMGVKELSNSTYATEAANGTYVFNTWRDGGHGSPISQTIPGLPSGHYRLVVTLSSDQNNKIWIQANDKKELKTMERAANIGSDYQIEFDVAQDTQEVTITITGGDGTDQFPEMKAGTWYKADNFRLYRHDDGQFKTCDFYDRLQTAIRRLATIAATLPDKYRVQWSAKDYQDLIDEHIKSDHTADPMGSNGSKEIDELFARFRTLVLSQTESDADLSGAIRNFSFELGDLTGWNISNNEMSDATDTKVTKGNQEDGYKTEGLDREYIFNTWDNHKSNPVYQDITGMPAGRYRLTVLVASDPGNRFYIAAGDTNSEMLTTNAKEKFDKVSMEFDVAEDNSTVRIGVYPSADGNFSDDITPLNRGPWFKADNFNLTLIGRNIDIRWKMECEDTGTLILPFDAELPADLELHSITASDPTETPSDNNFYNIARITTVEGNTIKANTPYLVTRKKTAASAENGMKKAAPVADADGYYTFSGMTTHKADTYTDGMLTGTLVQQAAKDTDHHLHIDANGNVGFFYHDGTYEHEFVEPYHVYITTEDPTGGSTVVPPVYLEEPMLPLEWTMETPTCGTIILPFEADLPEGLVAYTLESVLTNTQTFTPEGETEGIEYQLIDIYGETYTHLQANTPYFVKIADTPSVTSETDEEATETVLSTYKFTGKATNTDDSYTYQALTGLLTTRNIDAGDYVLMQLHNTHAFIPIENATEMQPYHAYIDKESTGAVAPYLLFSEPTNEDFGTGVQEILLDSDTLVDVYTTSGICLRSGVKAADALKELQPGLYILRGGKASLTIMKRR